MGGLARRFRGVVRSGGIATVALLLFGWSPHARAADITFGPVNAQLVFSPFTIYDASASADATYASVCAWNFNSTAVTAAFTAKSNQGTVPSSMTRTIPPASSFCYTPDLFVNTEHSFPLTFVATIELQSPTECSLAQVYPGPCRVLGSLEIGPQPTSDISFFIPSVHLEPVLFPGKPGINPPPQ